MSKTANKNNETVNNSEVKKFDFPNFLILNHYEDLKIFYSKKICEKFTSLDISGLIFNSEKYNALNIKNLIIMNDIDHRYDLLKLKKVRIFKELEEISLKIKKVKVEKLLTNDQVALLDLEKKKELLEKEDTEVAEKLDIIKNIMLDLEKYKDLADTFNNLENMTSQDYKMFKVIQVFLNDSRKVDLVRIFEPVIYAARDYSAIDFLEKVSAEIKTKYWKAYTKELDDFLKGFQVEKGSEIFFNSRTVSYNETEKRNISSMLSGMKIRMDANGQLFLTKDDLIKNLIPLLCNIIIMKKQGIKVVYYDPKYYTK